MAKKKGKSSADAKIRKKKWVEIVSPQFNNQKIGETHVFDIEEAVGKPVKINLMNLVGDPRKQNTDIYFKTIEQIGETGVKAEVQGYIVQQPSLRKMVRRGKTKIQDSFKCYTADKKAIVIKTFILTRRVVERSVSTGIREKIRNWTVNKVSKMNFTDFIQSIIESRFRKEIVSDLSKIYPVKFIEFNTIQLLNNEKGSFEEPSAEKAAKKKAKKEAEEAEEAENAALESAAAKEEVSTDVEEATKEVTEEAKEETSEPTEETVEEKKEE